MSWYFITSDGNVFHMSSIARMKSFTAASKASGCGYLVRFEVFALGRSPVRYAPIASSCCSWQGLRVLRSREGGWCPIHASCERLMVLDSSPAISIKFLAFLCPCSKYHYLPSRTLDKLKPRGIQP